MQWRDELTRRFPQLANLEPGCYAVGGAVRDLLLGREPLDADLACHDPLDSARRITAKVIRLGSGDELTAYRAIAGEHVYDFAAITGDTIEEDLARRDFTMNAMAVDLGRDVLLDPYGGRRDVDARVVRMIRASNFDDDPLRLLKAVRMAVAYRFEIDPDTLAAIRQRADRITTVAVERVTYELSLILSSGTLRRAIDLLRQTRLAEPLDLRLRDIHEDDVPLAAAYALLVDDPRVHAERWRWSDALLREVLALQRLIDHHDPIALYDAGESTALKLPAVLRAMGRDDTLDMPDFSIRPLLSGDEIAEITGIGPGPEIGAIKRRILEAQIRGDITTRDEAIVHVRSG